MAGKNDGGDWITVKNCISKNHISLLYPNMTRGRRVLHQLVSELKFLIKMPPRKNRTLNEIHEQELEDRVMARMEDRGTDDEKLENPFGEDDDSSSDEQSGRRLRRNQRKDNRRWESGMRVNILDFVGDTLSLEGFINWLVMVEEVFEFKEVPENKRVSLIATKLRALEALKTSKHKVKGIVFQELSKSTTTTTISSQQSQDKGKGIMIEEPVKHMKKKDQISFDEEVTLELQAEFDEEERLAREKVEKEKEANIDLIEEWDDIQAKTDANYQLTERLQAQEQEELSVEEKAKLFQQLLEQRRKYFAAKSSEEKRNKPPTQAQQRKIMCTYLKNMEGKKLKDLKNKSFDSIHQMLKSFDREDLEDLYKLVKARYGSTRPVESMDYPLWNDLKIMFEPHVEDAIWRNQQGYKVLEWKLYDSCGVHSLMMQSMQIYMPVEKRYPLTPPTITDILNNKKLQERIVEIKSLLNAASITAAHIRVNAAQLC
ncbi:hypothetical protein Tco_0256194 [Tanacetum coccineum]